MANNNQNADATTNSNTEKRGFASMDATKQREIASMGGKAAHANGNAHEWDSAEAREAGRTGGKASHSKSNDISTERTDAESDLEQAGDIQKS